jgi:ribonuclease R
VFEGFLPARKLPGDYFELDPTGTRMQGRHAGRIYRLGDPLEVKVDRIERHSGKVELSPG